MPVETVLEKVILNTLDENSNDQSKIQGSRVGALSGGSTPICGQ